MLQSEKFSERYSNIYDEGYSYEEGATSINIDVGSYSVMEIKVPNYMFQEYQG